MANFFKIKLKVLKIDHRGYTKALGEAIQVQVRQAAREWLRAVVLKVPVYSGWARSSLVPLGRYLRVAIPISPDPEGLKRYPNGMAKGQAQQSFDFKAAKYTYTFTYNTEVPHYLINEFHVGLGSPPLRHPTPWRSLDAGRDAFNQYLHANLKPKLPKISDYITLEDE